MLWCSGKWKKSGVAELKDSGEWAEEGCSTILKNEAGAKSSRVWLL